MLPPDESFQERERERRFLPEPDASPAGDDLVGHVAVLPHAVTHHRHCTNHLDSLYNFQIEQKILIIQYVSNGDLDIFQAITHLEGGGVITHIESDTKRFLYMHIAYHYFSVLCS